MVENLSPDPYFKNQDLAYLCISSLKIHIVFNCMPKSRTTKTMKLRCCPLSFTLCKAFLKQKRSETSLPASCSPRFLKEKISHVVFSSLTTFYCLIAIT